MLSRIRGPIRALSVTLALAQGTAAATITTRVTGLITESEHSAAGVPPSIENLAFTLDLTWDTPGGTYAVGPGDRSSLSGGESFGFPTLVTAVLRFGAFTLKFDGQNQVTLTACRIGTCGDGSFGVILNSGDRIVDGLRTLAVLGFIQRSSMDDMTGSLEAPVLQQSSPDHSLSSQFVHRTCVPLARGDCAFAFGEVFLGRFVLDPAPVRAVPLPASGLLLGGALLLLRRRKG